MARVSIEERAAAAAKKLARAMRWTRTDALGRLYFFWHDSQELEQTHCTAADVALWMDVDQDGEPSLIAAMVEAGFLVRCEDGRLLICGNEKHIESLRQRRDAAKEGGKRSAEARALQAKSKQTVEPSASTETQASDEPSSLLGSAVLCSAKEEKVCISASAPEEPVDNSVKPPTNTTGKPFPDEVVEKCTKAWLDTLAVHGIKTEKLQPFEESMIFQALKRYGPDGTLAALVGIRFEPKSVGDYDPGLHLRLSRVFDEKLIDKWWNLARRDRDKRAAKLAPVRTALPPSLAAGGAT